MSELLRIVVTVDVDLCKSVEDGRKRSQVDMWETLHSQDSDCTAPVPECPVLRMTDKSVR